MASDAMASAGAADVPLVGTHFMHSVVVVCECPDQAAAAAAAADDARPVVFTLQLDATHTPAAPIPLLFSFGIDTAAGRAPCLQISPDCLISLIRTVYDGAPQADLPPYMDLVREQLSTTRNIARLQFRLHRYGRLVQPVPDLPGPGIVDANAASALKSLATASIFSAYMPDRAMSKVTYNTFFKAAQPFLRVTTRDGDAEAMSVPPPAYGPEDEEGHAPRPAESDNDTVAVTTPSGFESPSDENTPPAYAAGDGSESRFLATASYELDHVRKRHPHSSGSSECSTAPRRRKRNRWSPGAAEIDIETESPTPSAEFGPLSRLDALEAHMKLQGQQMETLKMRVKVQEDRIGALVAENREFSRRNRDLVHQNAEFQERLEELEGRLSGWEDLESRVGELGEQHDTMEETLTHVELHRDELDDDFTRLGQKLDDVIEEVDARVHDSTRDVMDEYRAELRRKVLALLDD